jgi:hypothetical protein
MLFDISPLPSTIPTNPPLEPVTRAMLFNAFPKSWACPQVTISGDGALRFRTNRSFQDLLQAGQKHLMGGSGRREFLRRYGSGLSPWQQLACQFVLEQFQPGDRRTLDIEPAWSERKTHRESWSFSVEAGGFVQIVCDWPRGVAAHYRLWITQNQKEKIMIDED